MVEEFEAGKIYSYNHVDVVLVVEVLGPHSYCLIVSDSGKVGTTNLSKQRRIKIG
jgi:hypothetical protein